MNYEMLKKKTKAELIDLLIREEQSTTNSTSTTLKEIWKLNIDYYQENFILICLDSNNNIVKKKILFKGGISSASVDIKLLFHEVLTTKRCTRFLIAHNHPSGNMLPSKQDLRITDAIKEGAELLSLTLLDHIIFDEKRYYSFLEEDIL